MRAQATAAHVANAPVAQRAAACTRTLDMLAATLPQPLPMPDICAMLGPILDTAGRFTETPVERRARVQEQLTCAFVQEACQVRHACVAVQTGMHNACEPRTSGCP